MKQNLLIVGPNPVCSSSSTKALLQYVHAFSFGDVYQFYSNTAVPPEMSCKGFFRMTDSELLLSSLHLKKVSVGKEFKEIPLYRSEGNQGSGNGILKWLYRIGKKGTPLIQMLRDKLWNKKRVMNDSLVSWLKGANPSVVLLHSSNGIFLIRLGLAFAKMFNAKLVFEIADDYYFDDHFSLSPFYHWYRKRYKKVFEDVLKESRHVFYISDKMKKRYDGHFGINGTVIRPPYQLDLPIKPIRNDPKKDICYFGNIGMGRSKTLNLLGTALERVSPGSKIHIYCPQIGHGTVKSIKQIPSLAVHGPVSFKELVEITSRSDYLLFVESFDKKHLREIRYSLSTKIGDCLNSGIPFIAVGPKESGSMEYLKDNDVGYCCSDPKEIETFFRKILGRDVSNNLERSKNVAARDFSEKANEALIHGVYRDLLTL